MRPLHLAVIALAILVSGSALAQAAHQGTPTRIRGTVEKLDGQTPMVKSREGQDVMIAMAPDFGVSGVVKRNLCDIKAGDYIGAASVKGQDGKLRAVEALISPAAMRGTSEDELPWDLLPNSLMTNATVAGITAAPEGHTLKVTHKGSESEIAVGPEAPIVTSGPGDPGLLKPGAAAFLIARKAADGSLSAARVTAEKDGVEPPM